MEQAGPKYMQFRKFKYFQQKAFEIYTSFRFHNLKGVKLLARLRFGQNHLWEHKFKHSFLDLLNQSVVMVKTLTCQFTSVSTVLILPMKG